MLEGASVYAVVPCFDVEERLDAVIATMPAFVDRILVVDDASRDNTCAVIRAAAARDPRVQPLLHEKNGGVGAALVTGYRAALAIPGAPNDVFLVMAGDGQMDPRDAERVAGPVARGEAEYVKGNRFLGDASEMPLARRVVGELTSAATRLATRLPVSDAQCGYTALSRSACETLDLDGLWPRYGYPNDLLGQLAKRALRVREVPILARYRGERSGLRARDVARIFAIIARAGIRLRVSSDFLGKSR